MVGDMKAVIMAGGAGLAAEAADLQQTQTDGAGAEQAGDGVCHRITKEARDYGDSRHTAIPAG
ncbi:MAG: hypothetical protein Kow00111_06100 [Thermincola ferriacetica]